MSNTIRTRFAPSPTGYLHIGGARTALFNWLYARKNGGSFVLRVEDTDEARNTEEAVGAIYEGLRWLGMDWDEGPIKGGEFGPYSQSERKVIYQMHLDTLIAKGSTYEDDGVIRLKPSAEPITFTDLICGEITFDRSKMKTKDGSEMPGTALQRSDGSFIFHFVNVVDDLEMRISHCIRGEDHLSNTPKHIEIFRALGEEPPQYGHIPLIMNPNGSKMSKRDKGAQVHEYRDAGFSVEGVLNFLCLLGWSPRNDVELLAIDEVLDLFDLANIARASANFDLEKCKWFSQQYILKMSVDHFVQNSRPFVEKAQIQSDDPARIDAAIALVQEKVQTFGEVPGAIDFLFDPAYSFDEAATAKAFKDPEVFARLAKVREALAEMDEWDAEAFSPTVKATAKDLGVKMGAVMMPLRVALSGRLGGPGVFEMAEVLGKDETLRRLDRTVSDFGAG